MKPQQSLIQHRAEFSSRRRALFPSDENSCDSDLGCISPLNFDSDDCINSDPAFSLSKCVGDYDIIGLVDKSTAVNTPKSAPLSCLLNKTHTPSHVSEIYDESPTQKLKTPNDFSTNSKLPKLIRKATVDTCITSPVSQNFDCNKGKESKVRTALFPDMSLPPKSFYPSKIEHEVSPRVVTTSRKSSPKKSLRKHSFYLCKRGRFRSGEINAGVKHSIRKTRKPKKMNKLARLQAAINIIESSPLNEILPEPLPEVLETQEPPREPTPEPEPDPSKKFFKSSRHKGVVTVSKNIKLEVHGGKLSLMPQQNGVKRPKKSQETIPSKKIKLDSFDSEKTDSLISPEAVTNIIEALEGDNKENDVLMSPTSQMCNMTSGLALTSPKANKNLNTVLDRVGTPQNQEKYFPVFYPGRTVTPSHKSDPPKPPAKKMRAISKDQMLLDAGQKKWGATQCPECKIIYHQGDPGDEIMHLNYHNAGNTFRFNGWKYERVVSELADGRIIQIAPGDSKIWWKKVSDVMEVVNRELGFYDIEFNASNSQVFFYIKNRIIIGTLVAEVKTTGYKLLTTAQDTVDLCSEEAYPIKCGVSRIWVSQHHRKKGVGSALMNSLKRNFVFGHILKNEDIAFSSPTEMGKIFGRNYFKTPNFFIYF